MSSIGLLAQATVYIKLHSYVVGSFFTHSRIPLFSYLPQFLRVDATVSRSPLVFTPPWFWLVVGITLCLLELLLRKLQVKRYKLMALISGVSALAVSSLLWGFAIAMEIDWRYIMYEDFSVQIMFWMGMSVASMIWLRPAFLPRQKFAIPEATQAKTLTEILPGQTGRVLYEGGFWQARCEEKSGAIAPQQNVYIVRREGNTLIVTSTPRFQI